MVDLSRITPQASSAYDRLMQSWGGPLSLTSGYRSPEYNQRVGGAKQSQHMHGNAYDVSTQGMTRDQQLELIRMAQASGFGGVGVYDGSLHFDVGPQRAWGPDYTRKSLPDWAASALGVSSGGGADMVSGGDGGDRLMDGYGNNAQPRGLLEMLGIQKRDEAAGGETAMPFFQRGSFKDTMGNLAMGLNSLRLTPDPNLAARVSGRQQERKNQAKLNKTTEYLRQIAPEAASLVEFGMFSPAEALTFSRDEQMRDIARQASEALQAGDMKTAYALAMQLSPTAFGQAIAQQGMQRKPEVISDGQYTVSYGPDGQPTVTLNQAVIDEQNRQAKIKDDKAKTLPARLQTVEEEDFAAIDTADALSQQIGVIAADFGYDPETGSFNGPLQFGPAAAIQSNLARAGVGGQTAQEIRNARLRYERFIKNYVNESLRLNKGTQTEGDAQRAADAIDNSATTADAWQAINDLMRINDRARRIRENAIKSRRERYDAPPVEVPQGWSVVQ